MTDEKIIGEENVKNALRRLKIEVPKWSRDIPLKINGNEITMFLTRTAAGLPQIQENNKIKKPDNMQDNSACFEGWAAALKACRVERIRKRNTGIDCFIT